MWHSQNYFNLVLLIQQRCYFESFPHCILFFYYKNVLVIFYVISLLTSHDSYSNLKKKKLGIICFTFHAERKRELTRTYRKLKLVSQGIKIRFIQPNIASPRHEILTPKQIRHRETSRDKHHVTSALSPKLPPLLPPSADAISRRLLTSFLLSDKEASQRPDLVFLQAL